MGISNSLNYLKEVAKKKKPLAEAMAEATRSEISLRSSEGKLKAFKVLNKKVTQLVETFEERGLTGDIEKDSSLIGQVLDVTERMYGKMDDGQAKLAAPVTVNTQLNFLVGAQVEDSQTKSADVRVVTEEE